MVLSSQRVSLSMLEKGIEEIKYDPQSTQAIEKVENKIKELQERVKECSKDANSIGNWFEGALKYYDVNERIFAPLLGRLFPIDACKFVGSLASLIFKVIKIIGVHLLLKESRILREIALTTDPKIPLVSEQKLRQMRAQINAVVRDLEKIKTEGQMNFIVPAIKATVGSLLPHSHKMIKSTSGTIKQISNFFFLNELFTKKNQWVFHLQGFSNIAICCGATKDSKNHIHDKGEQFLKSLKEAHTLTQVKDRLAVIGIEIPLPPTINEWKENLKTNERLLRYLRRACYCFYGEIPITDVANVQSWLVSQGQNRNKRLQEAILLIKDVVDECNKKSFQEIIVHLKDLHINLDTLSLNNRTLPIPPTTKEEWLKCSENGQFCEALAEQWVNYQETSARLLLQGLQPILLSKLHVEEKFLRLQMVENTLNLVSFIIQLILSFPQTILYQTNSLLEVFVKDLAKDGIPGGGAAYLFFPELNFKLGTLIMKFVGHFFAGQYKPNEYSFEGYRMSVKMRLYKLHVFVCDVMQLIGQAVLWLSIHLENRMNRLNGKKSVEEAARLNAKKAIYEKFRSDITQNIKNIEKNLEELRVKDAKNNLKQGVNDKEFDPIKNFVEAFLAVDPKFFPPNVVEFFEENLGIDFGNKDKTMVGPALRKVLAADGAKLIDLYTQSIRTQVENIYEPTREQ